MKVGQARRLGPTISVMGKLRFRRFCRSIASPPTFMSHARGERKECRNPRIVYTGGKTFQCSFVLSSFWVWRSARRCGRRSGRGERGARRSAHRQAGPGCGDILNSRPPFPAARPPLLPRKRAGSPKRRRRRFPTAGFLATVERIAAQHEVPAALIHSVIKSKAITTLGRLAQGSVGIDAALPPRRAGSA